MFRMGNLNAQVLTGTLHTDGFNLFCTTDHIIMHL
uniref:Uncharacterized protein n=1 Tax=Anguilla anguilla TaxID=7936 RepID=A0A0E9SYV2_ANGAN